jgi:Spy/CpxP family protein refolding chaperone
VKKIILSALVLGVLLHAGDTHKVAELVKLPHPMKVLASDNQMAALDVTEAQKKRLETEIAAVFPSKMHAYFDKAHEIEKRIRKAVMREGKGKTDVADDLEALSRIKLAMTRHHIDALNALQSILTKDQFKRLMKTMHRSGQQKRSDCSHSD